MKTKKQQIETAFEDLRQNLSKGQINSLSVLVAELDDDGRAKLSAILSKLYPDKAGEHREKVPGKFRKFCQLVNAAASDSKISFKIESDRQTRSTPENRILWIEAGEGVSQSAVRELERKVAADAAAGPETVVPVSGVDPNDSREIVRYFILSSRVDSAKKGALIKQLQVALGTHPTTKFVLDVEILVGTDNKWQRNPASKIRECHFGLVLLSPAFLSSRFLGTEKLSAECLLPVAIQPVQPKLMDLQGLDPAAIVYDAKGRAFGQCKNPSDQAEFVAALFVEMAKRVPDPETLSKAQLMEEASLDAAHREFPKYFAHGHGRMTDIDNKLVDGKAAQGEHERGEDALRFLLNWVDDPASPPYCALLGETGSGKTTLCKALTRELKDRRDKGDKKQLIPLYFDLRPVGKEAAKRTLTLEDILNVVLTQSWKAGAARETVTARDVIEQVQRDGAIIIWDGLDEVLVHIDTHAGEQFTRQLYRLRPPNEKANSRLLVSCRTHYFRTLPEQKSHFRAEDRDNVRAESYRAFLLLPFTRDQIRDYIAGTLPEENPDRVLETLDAIHNLSELATRPYTLSLITANFKQIEQWKLEGKRVTGLSLYRLMVGEWLRRDTGKHQLSTDHKQELMEEVAARLWRNGARLWSIREIERWLDEFLREHDPDRVEYRDKEIALLREDLRTATFLVREGEDKFRFAHTSLQEYFLACYLRRALVDKRPELWALPKPSVETLDFLGQALFEDDDRERELAVGTLSAIRGEYRAQASETAFAYCLLALKKQYPACVMSGFQLPGADLSSLTVFGTAASPVLLMKANFQGANLRNAEFANVNLEGASFDNAIADRAEFLECRLRDSQWRAASLEGTIFRNDNLTGASFEDAECNRTAFIHNQPAIHQLGAAPAVFIAPFDPQDEGRVIVQNGHQDSVRCCAWSPDGGRVLSASDDKTLCVWDALTGQALLDLAGHQNRVNSCAWSPEGSRVLSASDDQTLRIWDVKSGEVLVLLTGHKKGVLGCAWSPDGSRVLSASGDKTLWIWDSKSGAVLVRLTGHDSAVMGCAWSPDGKRILSASADKTLRIWDAQSGQSLLTLSGHQRSVNGCAWSPDGGRVLSASFDNTLRIWDAHTGQSLLTLSGHQRYVWGCAWSPDISNNLPRGRVLSASLDNTLRIWDAHTGQSLLTLSGHQGYVWGCAWSPDGGRVLSASLDNTLRIWEAHTGQSLLTLSGHQASVWGCAWSPDGGRVLSASDNTLQIWDAHTDQSLLTLSGHQGYVRGFAWSPDISNTLPRGRVLSASADKKLRIWDADTGQSLLTLSGHESWVSACAWSPDGKRILSASGDKTLRIWDGHTGHSLLTLSGHQATVWSCAWSPDISSSLPRGRVLSASADNTLRIWDANTGQSLLTLSGHQGPVYGCASSPDISNTFPRGRVLSASADNTLRVWDARTGQSLLTLSGHQDSVWACAWSPDGGRVLSASYDKTLRIWDAHTGQSLLTLFGHQARVLSCAWSPDGGRVLSASADGTVRIWDANTGAELAPTMYHLRSRRAGAHPTWASMDHPNNRIVACGADAWRSIGWIVPEPGTGLPICLPAEAYGALPVKDI